MRISAKKRAGLMVTTTLALCGGVTAWTQQTQPPPKPTAEILRQAYDDMRRAREGTFEVVPQSVAMLEQATAADSTSGPLWNALTRAYLLQSAAAGQGGAPSAEARARALESIQRALDASERALRIDPNDPIALSNHGTFLWGLSAARGDREGMSAGPAEMNRAIELAPSLIPPRVKRGITALGLPPRFRNLPTVIEDVNALITVSEGTRAGDMLHLLLGDVYAEAGRAEEARREYEAAAKPSSRATEQARARLTALDQGGVPPAEMARLRAGVGTCTTCHAK